MASAQSSVPNDGNGFAQRVHGPSSPTAAPTPEPVLTELEGQSLKYAFFMPLFGQLGSDFASSLQLKITSNAQFCTVGDRSKQNSINVICSGEKTIALVLPSGFRGDQIGTWMGAKDYGTIDVIGNGHNTIAGGHNGKLCETDIAMNNEVNSHVPLAMPSPRLNTCSLLSGANRYQAHLNIISADKENIDFTLDANMYKVLTNGKFTENAAKIPVSLHLNAAYCNFYYAAWCGIGYGPAQNSLHQYYDSLLENTAPCR